VANKKLVLAYSDSTHLDSCMIAEDIFNRSFPQINEQWVKRPLQLTLAVAKKRDGTELLDNVIGLMQKGEDPLGLGQPGEAIDVPSTVKRLAEIRRVLAERAILPAGPEGD